MTPTEIKIRENIRSVIKLNGLTQKAVSRMINYSEVAFSQLMKGKIPLTEVHLRKIAKATKVEVSRFYKDVYPSKKINITYMSDKKIHNNVTELIDQLERIDPDEANRKLEAFLCLISI